MKKTFKFAIALIFASVLFISCKSTQTYMAVYKVALTSVESPKDAKDTYGEMKIVTLEESDSICSYSYEDKFARFVWFVHTDYFTFQLENHSGHPIRINWDDISYVNYEGYAERMIHKGIKFIEAEKSQGSINVPNGSNLLDLLVPSSNIYLRPGVKNYLPPSWEYKSLIPCYYKKKEDMIRDIEQGKFIGKKIKILFPVDIEGVRNDYCFEFTVNRFN